MTALSQLAASSAAVLRRKYGPSIKLGEGQVLKTWNRNYVVRFPLYGERSGLPSSVIAKQAKIKADTWYAELAGLRFLGRLPDQEGLAPRYLGCSARRNLLVMEDLGSGRMLEEYLTVLDESAAARALASMAELTARLHIAGLDRSALYRRLASPAAPVPDLPLIQSSHYHQWLPAVTATLSCLGIATPEQALAEHEQVAGIIAAPGPFRTFTHGDIAPSQVHYSPAGIARLLDFEYAGYRHALYDVTAWQIMCPYPPARVKDMNEIYRLGLSCAVPPAADDKLFYLALLGLCVFVLMRSLRYILPVVLVEDKPAAPGMSGRQSLLYMLGVVADCGEEWRQLPALTAQAGQLRRVLAERWPSQAAPLPAWPAFRIPAL